MSSISKYIIKSLVFLCLFSCKEFTPVREISDFNFDWRFSLNNEIGAASRDFDDTAWEDVRLPHDWSAALPYDSVNALGNTGYVGGGIGWYRKSFILSNSEDKIVYLEFDGIYNHSEIWLNGKKIKCQVSGYAPFFVDITDCLLPAGNKNLLAVKVDRSRYADSRWYSGSGIYRNVRLVTANKLHIPIWGVFVTTPEVKNRSAKVNISVNVKSCYDEPQIFDVQTKIFSPLGELKGASSVKNIKVTDSIVVVDQPIYIDMPQLWSIDNPSLYTAVTEILLCGVVVDQYTTTFGIRDIEFDAENGFFLNGENFKIKGLCIHADGGSVGVAVPKEVWRRRLQKLKDGGCNALRIAHHPASSELLDLCDEMGFLVQDEFFDEWNYPKDKRFNCEERHDDYISRGYADWFEKCAEEDLKTTMLSHRNHPCIFQWSIGNEIEWTYPQNKKATGFFDNIDWTGAYFWSEPPFSKERIKEEYKKQKPLKYNIGETAKQLATWTREMDISRPVIANCILPSVSFVSGYTDALDIVGFSYRRVMYDYARENYPNKIVMGTESLPQWHEWKAVAERDFISGLFLWTGIDYLGEATNKWPQRGVPSGLLDVAGFEKFSYKMYKTLWLDEPQVYIGTEIITGSKHKIDSLGNVKEKVLGAWEKLYWYWPDIKEHWNYSEGDTIIVSAFTNQEKAELFLDNKSFGVKKLEDFPDHIIKWAVPFVPGTLCVKAKGVSNSITTSGSVSSLDIKLDKMNIKSDGYDLVHIEIQLLDENNNLVKDKEKILTFEIEGGAEIIGVDNGSLSNPYNYKGNRVITNNGKALVIVQSIKDVKHDAMITINAENIESKVITIKTIK